MQRFSHCSGTDGLGGIEDAISGGCVLLLTEMEKRTSKIRHKLKFSSEPKLEKNQYKKRDGLKSVSFHELAEEAVFIFLLEKRVRSTRL